MNKLALEMNKLSFSDIELETNLSKRQSKQLMDFINDNFVVNGFVIEQNNDLNITSIVFNDYNTKHKVKITLSRNSVYGINKLILKINEIETLYEFESSFVKRNLTTDFENLLNELTDKLYEY